MQGSGLFVKEGEELKPLPPFEGDPAPLYRDFLPDEIVHRPDHKAWLVVVDGRGRLRSGYKGDENPGCHMLHLTSHAAPADLKRTLDELVELLEMQDLLTKPVRNFSLGERMKCELVAALLHRPQVLFLDEPTLGLDVSMQGRLRRFLAEYNRRSGVTMILTSHYMADVTALCPRVILSNFPLAHRG